MMRHQQKGLRGRVFLLHDQQTLTIEFSRMRVGRGEPIRVEFKHPRTIRVKEGWLNGERWTRVEHKDAVAWLRVGYGADQRNDGTMRGNGDRITVEIEAPPSWRITWDRNEPAAAAATTSERTG